MKWILKLESCKHNLTIFQHQQRMEITFHNSSYCRVFCTELRYTTKTALLLGGPQGLVTIHVNILSMYKHVQQGRTPFLYPLVSSRVCFLKFLLIYSKPCLVQLPIPYCFQKISWPPRDYLLWRRSGRFCQEFAWVENSMDPKWK